jgi:hypothetical protein
MGEIMSYELERAKQEHIKNEAIKNGAHYCEGCRFYIYLCRFKSETPYLKRMDRGAELYADGKHQSILEVTNIITKEFPCEFGENK